MDETLGTVIANAEPRRRTLLQRIEGQAPPAMRAFASTLFGDRSKIDESFFHPDELEILRATAERAMARGDQYMGYGDYAPNQEKAFRNYSVAGDNSKSFLHALTDTPSSLSYTLGMGKVRREPDGSVVINDKYDFAASKQRVDELKAQGLGALLKQALLGLRDNGLLGVGNVVGNLMAPEGHGRDVEVRIPPSQGPR